MEATTKKMTTPFWSELVAELSHKIESLEKENTSILTQAQNGLQYCKELLKALEALVEKNGFRDEREEILFFKEVKPKFYSRLIYYYKLYNIEVGRPVGTHQDQVQYLQKELDRIKEFFEDNKFFYQYFRGDETYLDEKLFLRTADTTSLSINLYDVHSNPDFSTPVDYILSRILANEMLLAYLNKAISAVNNEPITDATEKTKLSKTLSWTEAKSALIELIYAFKARGSFNNGKATLKEITDYFQTVFNIEINNVSRDFQDILSRKRSYTYYLDALKESYLKYIDALDNPK
jgi:hypothetical protein